MGAARAQLARLQAGGCPPTRMSRSEPEQSRRVWYFVPARVTNVRAPTAAAPAARAAASDPCRRRRSKPRRIGEAPVALGLRRVEGGAVSPLFQQRWLSLRRGGRGIRRRRPPALRARRVRVLACQLLEALRAVGVRAGRVGELRGRPYPLQADRALVIRRRLRAALLGQRRCCRFIAREEWTAKHPRRGRRPPAKAAPRCEGPRRSA